VAIIEGVMGLFDGRLGTDGFASTAHLAKLTESPVILVLDVTRSSRTLAAIAAGMATFDPDIDIAGVVLNRTGSPRNEADIVSGLDRVGLRVFGSLPRNEELATPSRHLGLVPAAERDDSVAFVHRLGLQVRNHLDLDALLEVARAAPEVDADPWSPEAEVSAVEGRPVIAVAGGQAFTFRYPETEELLGAAGCDVVTFDPLTDSALPQGTQGIYLGGGFPEVYAHELAGNESLVCHVRAAVYAGIPTVAECAGLLYLVDSLDGASMVGAVPATAQMDERLTLRYPNATATVDSLLTRAGERVTGHEFHRTQTIPAAGEQPAWEIDGSPTGYANSTLHASYLHVHWAGHPQLAQRFAAAAASAAAVEPLRTRAERSRIHVEPSVLTEPLRHHGDAEVASGILDFAVNVYDGPRPAWLEAALNTSLAVAANYPDASEARVAIAQRHQRRLEEVLPTAGAAEAFALIARLKPWARPVVIHPQFTEPQVALAQAGCEVTEVYCDPSRGFVLDPDAVPEDADLVIVGNPTNPTGVLHPAREIKKLLKRGRLVVVDEAFMDAVPGEPETLVGERLRGLIVVRSLTKHWSIPGVRAGYVVGHRHIVPGLEALQTPWSVSTPAIAATVACTRSEATHEARRRAVEIGRWRSLLQRGLTHRGVEHIKSSASFVLARPGVGIHQALRQHGIAVRRADTFPGLNPEWIRIAVRPPEATAALFEALDRIRPVGS
ncbi:MAG TPA: Rv2231c family pyridoxal phosphate-dependent protein CobC, partial [Marmoricola sp.]|nr:Rv2231c family pyridoxal phosphate-dependent protein CobC [Marmoricola sp.]